MNTNSTLSSDDSDLGLSFGFPLPFPPPDSLLCGELATQPIGRCARFK